VQVTLNMSDAVVTGHNYQVEIFDADNNSVGALNEGGWHNNVDDKTLTGSIQIPAIGNYKVVLTNNESGTTAVIKGITLAYAGGAIQNIPCTMMPIDALKSARAYVDGSGEFHFTTEEEHGHATEEWAKWRMHVTKDGYYKFTTSVNSNNGHSYLVTIYNADETVEKGSVAQSGDDIWGAPKTFSTGNILLEEGDYILKVQNTTANSNGRIVNVVASYEGGATITVPAEELIGAEAVLVDNGNLEVYKDGDNLQYDDNEFPLQEYVYWNINATRAGDMNLILNVVAPAVGDASGHQFLVELYTDLGGSPIASTAEAASSHATGPITLPVLNIPATGNYLVKLTNQTQWSSAILHSIQFTYAGGAVINVPGELVGEEAVLCKEDGGTLKMFHRPNGDIEYNDNGNPESEYALWNIHAAAACELSVTLNIAKEGHLFTVKLYNGSTLLGSAAETTTTEWDNEPINLADHLTIPAAGDYTIKLINSEQWSHGALHSITLTEVAVAATVTLDEAATDNSAWAANVGGAAVNVELTRTFTGGMYNTISLPFAVESDAVETAFGAGVELMYMTSATLDGTVLDLEFASTTSIYQGTPYLIKPVANVVNPTFANVTFTVSDASTAATGGTAADFIGTFIKKTIPASTQNLYLQANNILQYSQSDVTIKGTRAYFHLTGSGSAAVVRPRIVLNGQVLTDIELVNGEPQVNGKFIENGQLIILRDGVRYNALGTRVK
ncbi:MAG: hypothetical protein II825_09640, partial [Paludibacteraceae bacterium]|nr:hypothetical protein [Paludibacteraceae bacterium]